MTKVLGVLSTLIGIAYISIAGPTRSGSPWLGLSPSVGGNVKPTDPVELVRSRRQSDNEDSEPNQEEDEMQEASKILPKINKNVGTNLNLLALDAENVQPSLSENVTILTIDTSKANFVDVLLKCIDITKHCSLTSFGSHICFLSCVIDPFPLLRNLVHIFRRTGKSLCRPIGTMFDTRLGQMRDYNDDIQRFPTFLMATPRGEDIGSYQNFEADSLPFQFIKYGKTPINDLLKPVVGTIASTLQGSSSSSSFSGLSHVYNHKCRNADLLVASQMLADVFISHHFTADVTLPGWFVTMNLFNLNMGPLESSVQAIRLMAKFFIGVECDLLEYSKTGSVTECKLVVGKSKPFAKTVKTDQDFLCGTLPDLPSVDLHKLLPEVFPLDDGGADVNTV